METDSDMEQETIRYNSNNGIRTGLLPRLILGPQAFTVSSLTISRGENGWSDIQIVLRDEVPKKEEGLRKESSSQYKCREL